MRMLRGQYGSFGQVYSLQIVPWQTTHCSYFLSCKAVYVQLEWLATTGLEALALTLASA